MSRAAGVFGRVRDAAVYKDIITGVKREPLIVDIHAQSALNRVKDLHHVMKMLIDPQVIV